MNALVKQTIPVDVVEVLSSSLYPGAKRESVEMVLAWCRATGRDPMKKPIHIVPMWVKDATTGQGGMRDVLMPGIGTYRTDAANTGEYAGKDEPEFGPTVTATLGGVKVTYPEWCKVTVYRLVKGQPRGFSAKEFWLENYATAKKDTDAPNAMWNRRAFGQLAKCSESQALRMAFPDETGNTNTAEEMEGKTFDGVTIDATPETKRVRPVADDFGASIPEHEPKPKPDPLTTLKTRLAACSDRQCVLDAGTWWAANVERAKAAGKVVPEMLQETAKDMLANALGNYPMPLTTAGPTLEEEFGEEAMG